MNACTKVEPAYGPADIPRAFRVLCWTCDRPITDELYVRWALSDGRVVEVCDLCVEDAA